MALSYKARRRWALVILLIGLPLYVVVAVNLVGLFERPSVLVELAVYIGLGFLWALPFRFIFRFKSVIGNANALCIVDIICPASVASTFFRICDHYRKSVFFL